MSERVNDETSRARYPIAPSELVVSVDKELVAGQLRRVDQ